MEELTLKTSKYNTILHGFALFSKLFVLNMK